MSKSESPPQSPVEPVPAATVMLVRDAEEGPEVFLMERGRSITFGGLHVFPGGRLDAADADPDWSSLATGVYEASARRVLGVDEGGLAYWIACIRECFEEAGVLLATRDDGEFLPLTDPARRARFAEWRVRLNNGEGGVFETMCREEGLRLAADRLAYVAHWITPIDQPKRFNTRFFVARAPGRQEALHDGVEAVESAWMRPEEALARFARRELNLISPTFKNLEALSGFSSTEALLAAKREIDPATIPMILPTIRPREEGAEFEESLDVVGQGGRRFDGSAS